MQFIKQKTNKKKLETYFYNFNKPSEELLHDNYVLAGKNSKTNWEKLPKLYISMLSRHKTIIFIKFIHTSYSYVLIFKKLGSTVLLQEDQGIFIEIY